ncbi:MAG: response regulator transcription factor [bacterium]
MRLLVAENDTSFQLFLKRRLEEKCFAVDVASDAPSATELAEINPYDLIVLDNSLPGQAGHTLCHYMRMNGCQTPVILLSNMCSLEHKLKSFTAGVDDFIMKPFYFEELHARINAILRRPKIRTFPVLTYHDITLNVETQKVTRGRDALRLTRKEFAILELLLRNVGRVVPRGELLEHVWDTRADAFSRTIETHILNLRNKLNASGKRNLIHCLSGRGYKIDVSK